MGKFQARLWRWADRPMQYRVKILPMEFLVKWRLDRDRLLHTEHPLHSLRFSRQKVAWEVVGSSHIQHHLNRKCRGRSPTQDRKCRRDRSPTQDRKCCRGRSPIQHRKFRDRLLTQHLSLSLVAKLVTEAQQFNKGKLVVLSREVLR